MTELKIQIETPKKVEELQVSDWRKYLNDTKYVDIESGQNTWYVGLISEIKQKENRVTISFDGWSAEHNITIPLDSKRIAPIRSHTRGYTGNKKTNQRMFLYSEQEIALYKEQVINLVDTNLECMDPFLFTHFIRADLFIFLDSLLTSNFEKKHFEKIKIEDKEIIAIDNFCVLICRLYCKWLSLLPNLFSLFMDNQKNPFSYISTFGASVICSAPEFTDMMKLLLNSSDRTAKAFEEISSNKSLTQVIFIGEDNDWFSKHILDKIDFFGGLKLIEDLIKKDIPIILLIEIIEPYIAGLSFIRKPLLPFIKKIGADIFNKVTTFSCNDYSTFDANMILRLFNVLDQIENILDDKERRYVALKSILTISVSMINLPKMTSRLTGIGMINKMVGRKDKIWKWSKIEQLAEALVELMIIQTIFNENPHEEIISRSNDIIQLMLDNKLVEPYHIKIIWKSCSNKNENIARQSVEILTKIYTNISELGLHEIFQLIKSTPINDYNESLLNFLIKHTDSAISYLAKNKNAKSDIFDFTIFWRIIFESSLNESIKRKAMEAFSVFLSISPEHKKQYIFQAGTVFESPENICRSMQFLLKVDFISFLLQKGQDASSFDIFLTNYKVLEAVIASCVDFHKTMNDFLFNNQNLKGNIMGITVKAESGMAFGDQAKLYLDFIQAICMANQKINYGINQLETIWNLYYLNQFSEEHSNLLFSALLKEFKRTNLMFYGFFPTTPKLMEFFEKIFNKEDKFIIQNLTPISIRCFKKYFDNANKDNPHKKFVHLLPGIEMLWKISLEAKNEKIQKEAAAFLIELYYNGIKEDAKERLSIIEEFLKRIIFNFSHVIGSFKESLGILNDFIISVEETKYEACIDQEVFSMPPLLEINLQYPSENESRIVLISEKLNTERLLQQISNTSKIAKNRIRLLNSVNGDVTSISLPSLSRMPKIQIKIIQELIPFADKPSRLLCNTHEIFVELLGMLNNPNNEVFEEVWKLLKNLPKNEQIMDLLSLKKIEAVPINDWNNYLLFKDSSDCPRISYTLCSFASFLEEISKKEEFKKYKEIFMVKKGFQHIILIFNNNVSRENSNLSMKCLFYCLKVMNILWDNQYADSYFINVQVQKTLWTNISDNIISWIYSLIPPDKADPNFEASEICDILEESNNMLMHLVINNKELFLPHILTERYFEKTHLALFCFSARIRKTSKKWVQDIYTKVISPSTEKEELTQQLINTLLKEFLTTALQVAERSMKYFSLLKFLIERLEKNYVKEKFSEDLIAKMVEEIYKRLNKSNRKEDSTLSGLFKVLTCLISIKIFPKGLKDLFNKLLVALFGKHDGTAKVPNIANTRLHIKTRKRAMLLLKEIVKALDVYEELFKYLIPFYENPIWRGMKPDDWNLTSTKKKIGKAQHVGLMNMGSTCYMNSAIQQLFMIPEFRDPLLRLDELVSSDCILKELQKVFGVLYKRQYSGYQPKGLCEIMNIDVKVQKDVAEFLNTIFDNVQDALKNTPQSDLIKDTFEIRTSNAFICQECKTRSENISRLYLLGLEVKHKSSIIESLAAYTKPEVLEGENAYACENCGKKVTAIKQETISLLPNYLLIQLKRFEQSLDNSNRKLNSYFEFPLEIDMEEFTLEGQSKKQMNAQEYIKDLPKSLYIYKLKGVIIHIGALNAGHYYSYIRDTERQENTKEPEWLEFNDCLVREFKIHDLKEEAFGDKSELPIDSEEDMFTRTNNAYILVYQRDVILPSEMLRQLEVQPADFEAESFKMDLKVLKESSPSRILTRSVSAYLTNALNKEKMAFYYKEYLFQPEFIKMTVELITENENITNPELKKEMPNSMRFAFKFFFIFLVRSKMKNEMIISAGFIEEMCRKNTKVAFNIISLFCQNSIIREFLIDCPKFEARKCITSILKAAIKSLNSNFEQTLMDCFNSKLANKQQQDSRNSNLLINFISCLLYQIDKINKNYCGQYFEILLYFAQLSIDAKAIFNSCYLFGSCLEILGFSKNNTWIKSTSTILEFKDIQAQYLIECIVPELIKTESKLSEVEFTKQTPYIMGLIQELITRQDSRIFPADFEEIPKLIEETNLKSLITFSRISQTSLNFLSKLFLSLCLFDSKSHSTTLISWLINNMNTCSATDMKLYLRILNIILCFEDPTLYKDALNKILVEIKTELTSTYSELYLTCITFIDFLIDLCYSNEKLCEFFSKKGGNEQAHDTLMLVIEFIPKFKFPRANVRMARNVNAGLPVISEELKNMCIKANNERMEILTQIEGNNLKIIKDLGDDLYTTSNTILIDDLFDVFSTVKKKWIQKHAKQITCGMIKFSFDQCEENDCWIEIESNRIAMPGAICGNLRFKEKELLLLSLNQKKI